MPQAILFRRIVILYRVEQTVTRFSYYEQTFNKISCILSMPHLFVLISYHIIRASFDSLIGRYIDYSFACSLARSFIGNRTRQCHQLAYYEAYNQSETRMPPRQIGVLSLSSIKRNRAPLCLSCFCATDSASCY